MFIPCEITKTAFGSDSEVLMRYITEKLNGTIPLKYNQTENRIKKTVGKIYDDDETIKYYHVKSSNNKLSGGAIAVIVIVPIVVLAIIITTIYFVKTRNINKGQ